MILLVLFQLQVRVFPIPANQVSNQSIMTNINNINAYHEECYSNNFENVTTPLFVKWEDWTDDRHIHILPGGYRHYHPPRDWYIIQLGGNVGLNVGGGDPVWEYVRPCHWSGVILEPQPNIFHQLETNYADVADRIQTLNMGISDQPGNFSLRGGGETASLGNSNGNIVVKTLQQLWDDLQPLTRVDVLVVDVEGHEERVLALQDMPHPKPRLILYEMIHLKDQQRDKIDQKLKQQGYVWRNDLIHMDNLARRRNFPAQDRLYELM